MLTELLNKIPGLRWLGATLDGACFALLLLAASILALASGRAWNIVQMMLDDG